MNEERSELTNIFMIHFIRSFNRIWTLKIDFLSPVSAKLLMKSSIIIFSRNYYKELRKRQINISFSPYFYPLFSFL